MRSRYRRLQRLRPSASTNSRLPFETALLPRGERGGLALLSAKYLPFLNVKSRPKAAVMTMLDRAIRLPASAPEVLERLRRHRRIAHRIRDRGVAEEVLQATRI